MPFATTPDGTRLYFECHGTGTPLLLLAGQASDHREWDGVRAGFAQDAVAVLDQLGIERVHAYGVSVGGRVAQWLGIDHPQRLGQPAPHPGVARVAPLPPWSFTVARMKSTPARTQGC